MIWLPTPALAQCFAVAEWLSILLRAQWAYPFNEPVDTKRYDNYLNYVKRPMDFGTIKRNLETGVYKAPDDMLADMQQVGISLLLMVKFTSLVADWPKCICDHCSAFSWRASAELFGPATQKGMTASGC